MKYFIALFICLNSMVSSANYNGEIVGLGNLKSNIKRFDSDYFREQVYYSLIRQKIVLDTFSNNDLNPNWILNGELNSCDEIESCLNFNFWIEKTGKSKTIEKYNTSIDYSSSRGLQVMLNSVFAQMRSFSQLHEWDNYFMPGVSVDFYQPRNNELGNYFGPSVEFVFYSRSKTLRSRRSGPSRIKSYGKIGILKAGNPESNDIFLANLGVNLSFESNTSRTFLLPYFGLEVGGLFSKDIATTNFIPLLGTQIISNRRIIWSVQGGYLYSTKRFDDYSGYQFKTSLNLLLWK